MREVTVALYTIDELGGEARRRALDRARDINVAEPELWHEDLTRVSGKYPCEFQEDAAEKGFGMEEFYFRGFGSQGDGASFEASVDYEDYIVKNRRGNRYRALLNAARAEGGGLSIKTRGHYCHSNTMHLDGHNRYYGSERAEEQAGELAGEVLRAARDLAREFYRSLEREYEYLTSDEAVEDALMAHAVEFDATGKQTDIGDKDGQRTATGLSVLA